MTFDEKMSSEWRREVQRARNSILASKRDPIKLLADLFVLYQDDFDVTDFKTVQPKLYEILQHFCNNIPETHNELRDHSGELVRFFTEHQEEIRKCDVEMYYALLNFVDMLKCKHIYFDLLRET